MPPNLHPVLAFAQRGVVDCTRKEGKMTSSKLVTSVILGLIAAYLTMNAVLSLTTTVIYLASGAPVTWQPVMFLFLIGVFIAMFIMKD